jgi:hypothetical protein
MTHWVQCANDPSFCPVFPGDTRITVIEVRPFKDGMLPKTEFESRILDEAPAFLRTIIDLELPPVIDRLRIPALDSQAKKHLQDNNRDALTVFLEDHCHYMPGNIVSFRDFFERFLLELSPAEQQSWTQQRTSLTLPSKYARFKKGGRSMIGNLSFEPPPAGYEGQPCVVKNGQLVTGERQ